MSSSGKVILKLKPANKRRLKRRIKLLQREYRHRLKDFGAVQRSLSSVHGHLIHGHTYRFKMKLFREAVFVVG